MNVSNPGKEKIKISIAFFSLIFLFLSITSLAQTAPEKIKGLYWSPEKDAKIEIYKNGNHYFGKTVWAAIARKDVNNPNKELTQRNLLGLDILTNFSYEDGVYKDGKVYDPNNGKTYSCKITLEGNNLKVRGYIGMSLFGRTEIFERIQ
jgi:uncharacterized protein (DUF2147 family)